MKSKRKKTKTKQPKEPEPEYTRRDELGIRWRLVGSRWVSELADKVMADCKLPRIK